MPVNFTPGEDELDDELELEGSEVESSVIDNHKQFEFLTGNAGSGKTYEIRRRIEENPQYGLMCASTGIAAVNLGEGVTTLNSLLGYGLKDNLGDFAISGKLRGRLRQIALKYRHLVIDEVSMMDNYTLDTIVDEIEKVNEYETVKQPFGLVLTGDFCFGAGTKVMAGDGDIVPVESIAVGDWVMGIGSVPQQVLKVTRGNDFLYRVAQTNGDSYVVNSKHPLVLKRSAEGQSTSVDLMQRYPKVGDDLLLSAPELREKSKKFRTCFVGYREGCVQLSTKKIKIDPYFLGLWLGDGDSDSPRITSMDPEVIEYCRSYAKAVGLNCVPRPQHGGPAMRLHLSGSRYGSRKNILFEEMRKLKLIKNKHIPNCYLLNSESVRLSLLAGLLDSDGSWSGNRYRITLVNGLLIQQVKQLAAGLGFRTKIREITNGHYKNGLNGGASTVTISGDTWRIPCLIARKKSTKRNLRRNPLNSTLCVNPLGKGDYFGFEISGERKLFLLADGTVVHNCQLAPVPDMNDKKDGKSSSDLWAFKSDCWKKHFAPNVNKLTKIWRQSDPNFLEAMNAARLGDGRLAAEMLQKANVEWRRASDLTLNGGCTTILGRNANVDTFNGQMLRKLTGESMSFDSTRWTVQRKMPSEWNKIPETLELKVGAYVMILKNSLPIYANGDCGWVDSSGVMENEFGDDLPYVDVKLKRNEKLVRVFEVTRNHTQKYDPTAEEIQAGAKYDTKLRAWIMGGIEYMPLRIAYASTVHKSQGLTLDSVLVDVRESFMGFPSMVYVALSRCKTPEGLRIVGTPELLAKRCKIAEEVREWL